MSRKVYKEIKTDSIELTIWGSNRPIKLRETAPDKDGETKFYFIYERKVQFLEEFNDIGSSAPSYLHEFQGIKNDSMCSGVLYKFCENTDLYIKGLLSVLKERCMVDRIKEELRQFLNSIEDPSLMKSDPEVRNAVILYTICTVLDDPMGRNAIVEALYPDFSVVIHKINSKEKL